MAITSITIENFKGIGDKAVTIPLRPITLLFGKNSAGKSTVLQALHYLREVLENRRPDPDKTTLGGDTIDLGGFYSLVHRHERERSIRIRVTFDVDDDGIPSCGRKFLMPNEEVANFSVLEVAPNVVSNNLNGLVDIESAWVEIVTDWDEKDEVACITQYGVGINDIEFLRFTQDPGFCPGIESVNFNHPTMHALDSEEPEDFRESTRYSLWSVFDADESPEGPRIFSHEITLPQYESLILDPNKPFIVDEALRAGNDFDENIVTPEKALFWDLVSQAATGPLKLLLEELRGIRYMGPLRDVPPRNHLSPKTPDESRWANGLAAWDALLSDPDLLERTNRCLENDLDLGYILNREDRISIDTNGEVMNNLRFLTDRFEEMGSEDLDADYIRKAILTPLEKKDPKPRVQLVDKQYSVRVDPADIGVGVSQILPVIVGALDPGPKSNRNRIFAVEQPELHVHPAVQVGLGDVFIEAVKNSERMMLIETHSEHLLLRLLRRVRESQETLVPVLLPEALSVVYVCATADGVEISPIEVNAEGDFDGRWPEGFFEERAEELF